MTVNKPEFESWDNIPKYSHYIAEPKLDGMRCLLVKKDDRLELMRDDGRKKSVQFPEIIDGLENIKIPNGTIIDGEVCILTSELTSDFQSLSKRINLNDAMRIKLLSANNPASFVAFDIVQHENQDIRNVPLMERKNILEEIKVQQVKEYDINELAKLVKELDMEGMVVKNPNSSYSDKWYKFKNLAEYDFKVVGYNSKKRKISSLILEDMDGKDMGSVNYPSNWSQEADPVGKIAIVLVQVMKDKNQKVRFPVLKELR